LFNIERIALGTIRKFDTEAVYLQEVFDAGISMDQSRSTQKAALPTSLPGWPVFHDIAPGATCYNPNSSPTMITVMTGL
jgi:hypothetical protein